MSKNSVKKIIASTIAASITASLLMMPTASADYYGYTQNFTGATINESTSLPEVWAKTTGHAISSEIVDGAYGKAADDSALKITSTATSGLWGEPPVAACAAIANLKSATQFNESETLINGSYYHFTASVAACDDNFYCLGIYAHKLRVNYTPVSGSAANTGDLGADHTPILGFTKDGDRSKVKLTAWGEDITPDGFTFKTKTWYKLDVIFNGITNTMDTYLNGEFIKTVELSDNISAAAQYNDKTQYSGWHLYYLKYIGIIYDRYNQTPAGAAGMFDNVGFGNYYYGAAKPTISPMTSGTTYDGTAVSDSIVVLTSDTVGNVKSKLSSSNTTKVIDANGAVKADADAITTTDRVVETDGSIYKYYNIVLGTPTSSKTMEDFSAITINDANGIPSGGAWGNLGGSRASVISSGKYGLSSENNYLEMTNSATSGNWGTPPVFPNVVQFATNILVDKEDYLYLAATVGSQDDKFYQLGIDTRQVDVKYTTAGGADGSVSEVNIPATYMALGFDRSSGNTKIMSFGQDITPAGFVFKTNQMYRLEAVFNNSANTLDAYLNGKKLATVDYSSVMSNLIKDNVAYDFNDQSAYSSYSVSKFRRLAIVHHKPVSFQGSTTAMFDDVAYGVNNKYAGAPVISEPATDLVSTDNIPVNSGVISLNGRKDITVNALLSAISGSHELVCINLDGELKEGTEIVTASDIVAEKSGDYYIYHKITAGASTINDFSACEIGANNLPTGWGMLAGKATAVVKNDKFGLRDNNSYLEITNTTNSGAWGTPPVFASNIQYKDNKNVGENESIYFCGSFGAQDENFYMLGLSSGRVNVSYKDNSGTPGSVSDVDFPANLFILGFDRGDGTTKIKSFGQDITPAGFEFKTNQFYRLEAVVRPTDNELDAYLNGKKLATVDYSSAMSNLTKSSVTYDFNDTSAYQSYRISQFKRLAVTNHKTKNYSAATTAMVDDLGYLVYGATETPDIVEAVSDLSCDALSISDDAISLGGKSLTGNGVKGYITTEHELYFIDSEGNLKSDSAVISTGDKLVEVVGNYLIYRDVVADSSVLVASYDFDNYTPTPNDGAPLNGSTQMPDGFLNFGSKCMYLYGEGGVFGKLSNDKAFKIWNVNANTTGESGFTRYTKFLWSDAEIAANPTRNFQISAEIGAGDYFFTEIGLTNRFNFNDLCSDLAFSFKKENGKIIMQSFGEKISDDSFVFKINRMYKIDLVYVGNQGLLDIYVDGKKVAQRDFSDKLAEKGETQFSKFKYAFIVSDFSQSNGELGDTYFDNLSLKYVDGMYPSIDQSAVDSTKLTKVYGFDNFEMYALNDTKIKNGILSPKTDKNTNNGIKISGDNANKYISYCQYSADPIIDILAPADGDNIIYDADYTFVDGTEEATLFSIMDKNDFGVGLVKLNASNKKLYAHNNGSETAVASITKGKEFNIKVVIDQINNTYDLYVDNQLVADNYTFSSQFIKLRKFRLTSSGSTSYSSVKFNFDNWILYEGVNFIDKNDYIRNTVFYTTDDALGYFDDAVAFYAGNDRVYINGEIQNITNSSLNHNGDVYISDELLSEAFGLSLTKTGDDYKIGASIVAGLTENSKNYVLVSSLCETISDLNYNLDRNDFCIIGKGLKYENADYSPNGIDEYNIYSRQYLELSDLILYSRPSADALKTAFAGSVSHPSVICTADDFTRIKNEIQNDTVKAEVYASLLEDADEALSLSIPTYQVSGSSLNVHDYAEPLRDLALAYQLSGEGKYAQKAYDLMTAFATYKDWHPSHFLDIGVVMGAMAIAYDWTYDWMEANVTAADIKVIEDGIINNGLIESKNAYLGNQYSDWVKTTGNWNGVCNSGVVLAATALYDRLGDETFEYISYALRSLEYHLNSFFPDGGSEEGLSYLNYTSRHLSYIFGVLDKSFGQDFGYFNASAFEKSGYYALCLDGSTGGFNFHDSVEGEYIYPQIAWYAAKLNDPALHRIRYEQYQKNPNVDTWYDLLYLDTQYKDDRMNLPIDMYYRQVETGMMRSGWSSIYDTYVGYHAGKNTAGHMHYDAGDFVFDSQGIRWAVDLGRDDYDIVGYNETDYCPIYRKRAEGHNVLVLNPDETAGQVTNSNSYVERTESNSDASLAILNLDEAYGRDAYSAKRGILLDSNREALTVRDELVLKGDTELYWFMHTKATVTIDENDPTIAYLKQYGRTLRLKFASNQANKLTLSVENATQMDPSIRVAGEAANTEYKKLVISGNVSGNFTLTVKMVPQVAGKSYSGIGDISLKNWSLEEDTEPSGEIVIYQNNAGKLVPADMTGSKVVDFRINNTTNEATNGDVWAAVYSEGKLYSLQKIDNVSLPGQLSTSEKIEVNFDEIEEPSIKLFYWDRSIGLKPLMPSVEKAN